MTLLRPPLPVLLAVGLTATVAAAAGAPPDAAGYLAGIRRSSELQELLDRAVADLEANDPALRRIDARVALLDLSTDPPQLADRRGESPIYPASVVKFVYLMAAYAWQEQGTLRIDAGLDDSLREMIHDSSNRASQQVFARLTRTEPGPELAPEAYAEFAHRRLAVDRWLTGLSLPGLHCVNPTYDGDGDLFGREKQFVADHRIAGGLPSRDGEFANRNAMTAIGTAELLALLATDRALSAEDSAIVRRRMRRDPREQPHLAYRLAGGAARLADLEVYSKSGTWGPIYADAGIVRHVSGRQFVLVVFTRGQPPYRGNFIADLTQRIAAHLLAPQRVP